MTGILNAILVIVLFVGFVAILLLAIDPKRSVALMHPKE